MLNRFQQCQNLPVEYSCDEYDSVKSVSVNASSSNSRSSKKSGFNVGNDDSEMTDCNKDSSPRTSEGFALKIIETTSKRLVSKFKAVEQTNSTAKWSDIVAGRANNYCESKNVNSQSTNYC